MFVAARARVGILENETSTRVPTPIATQGSDQTQSVPTKAGVTFCVFVRSKAKLYRFDVEKNEWKERGLGVMKLMEHKETKKPRLLMRRDKTLKICCNQSVIRGVDMKVHPGNDKSWVWTAADFSDGEVKQEMLCIRFGSPEKANAFKEAYLKAQEKLPRVEEDDESDDGEEGPEAPEDDDEEEEEAKESADADALAAAVDKVAV